MLQLSYNPITSFILLIEKKSVINQCQFDGCRSIVVKYVSIVHFCIHNLMLSTDVITW